MAGQVRVGCSGWSYPHWRGRFYPEKLPAREHFAFYARHFDTVELNNSFYRQPPPERFDAWRELAPAGFLFAVKGSRYVSHIKRLAVEQKSIDMVVEPAVRLGEKLGPILFQLQANFHLDLERLARFLAMLPDHPRFAFEFRHDSWLIPAVCDLLRAHQENSVDRVEGFLRSSAEQSGVRGLHSRQGSTHAPWDLTGTPASSRSLHHGSGDIPSAFSRCCNLSRCR